MKKRRTFCALALAMAMPFALVGCYEYNGMLQLPPAQAGPVQVPDALLNALTADADVLPIATATFAPGTYITSSNLGFGYINYDPGYYMKVATTFSENQILSINILEHGETVQWLRRAVPTLPDKILVNQSTNVDTVVGATVTANAIFDAVNQAIVQAGANPEDLIPYAPTAPLAGDRFIPQVQHITVEPGTLNIAGGPLQDGEVAMVYGESPIHVRVFFDRNEFYVNVVGGGMAHGETPNWWNRVQTQWQVMDRQSTQDIDLTVGATRSSAAVLWAIEQAIVEAGVDPASLTPRTVTSPVQHYGEGHVLHNNQHPIRFIPGQHFVTVDGFIGPIEVETILNRTDIVRVRVRDHSETQHFFDMVMPDLQNAIETGQSTQGIDVTAGATVTHNAIIEAVETAIRRAGANPADVLPR